MGFEVVEYGVVRVAVFALSIPHGLNQFQLGQWTNKVLGLSDNDESIVLHNHVIVGQRLACMMNCPQLLSTPPQLTIMSYARTDGRRECT